MFRIHRLLIAYAIAIPMALILGYLVATPDMASIAVVGMVLFVLVCPLLLQWSHPLLIFFWSSAFIAGVLPGQAPLWMIFAAMTFGIGMVNLVMGHRNFLRAPELTKPLLFLAAVVVLTAKIRGGVGLHVMGSESVGAKKYVFVLVAILGYFALTSVRIPMLKSERLLKWFFLSSASFGLSNLLYTLGPAFYILYYIVSPDSALGQASADYNAEMVKRFSGLGPTGAGILCFMLARWGFRGLFVIAKPWRLLLLAIALAAGLFSGFRSEFAFLIALLAVQFVAEGLLKTGYLPAFCLLGALAIAPVLVFSAKMPAAVQRSLAAIPGVNIDPNVRFETDASSEWRLEMWKEVLPEVPKYLLVGKGYAIDPVDLYLVNEASRTGILSNYENLILSGDYHNGPLSILIPFGIMGAIAFLWLAAAGLKVLYCNYRYGDIRLKQMNTVLLSLFITRIFFFFFVFGAFSSQLSLFLGILGVSVSLNGGVCRRSAVARRNVISPTFAGTLAEAGAL